MQTKAMIPIRTIAPAAPKQMMFSRFLEQYSLKLIFFVSTMNVFSAAKPVMYVHYFFAATGKCVRVIFIPGADAESTSNFCGIFWRQSFCSFCRSRGRKTLRQIEKDCSVVENCGPALTGKENVE